MREIIKYMALAFQNHQKILRKIFKAKTLTEYRTLATAEIDGEEIEIVVELYRKSDDEWLALAEDGTWEKGPGEDFF